jgi:hypothetical protein
VGVVPEVLLVGADQRGLGLGLRGDGRDARPALDDVHESVGGRDGTDLAYLSKDIPLVLRQRRPATPVLGEN